MFRGIARGIVLVALTALTGSCGDTTTTPTPTIVTITETYSGTLIGASAGTFSFTTLSGGAITATLAALGPDDTKTVGFSLGTFSGSTCTVIMDNSQATKSFAFNATASSIGVYCVRIYDNGNVTTDKVPYTFTITVAHPQ